ncbi:HNH endonuclease signature motif containing protein [Blastomonas marina]|uniref:HNH endonuclease n=1 Tax=Blastomonas marina TaxID=1867408 RepID=UPI002AC9A40E|nr:HNH endonuclease signature motif containing protein [Blastomonas marina]WPZ03077.1 HNH endonuclease signature motif containing protein [Blastomonas marina]
MPRELSFRRSHAEEAIRLARQNGEGWLYQTYPKPGGQSRRSSTGFLVFEGERFPVKPLGRLASEIAGAPMSDNPITNVFRRHFERLGFQLIENLETEASEAEERQRRLAETWARPNQAKFRAAVFDLYGARSLLTGCETLTSLEAAHIVTVASGGGDEAGNGIPLRADLHRLFDAGDVRIDPATLKVSVSREAMGDYANLHGLNIRQNLSSDKTRAALASALRSRGK